MGWAAVGRDVVAGDGAGASSKKEVVLCGQGGGAGCCAARCPRGAGKLLMLMGGPRCGGWMAVWHLVAVESTGAGKEHE